LRASIWRPFRFKTTMAARYEPVVPNNSIKRTCLRHAVYVKR
jgi:hypothetical protein